MRYRLGGDGTDGIDCIHVVYAVLGYLEIATPPFKPSWYEAGSREILRDLLTWGERVSEPAYDGDVVLIDGTGVVFGVVWDHGILVVSGMTEKVLWQPLGRLRSTVRYCFRMRNN